MLFEKIVVILILSTLGIHSLFHSPSKTFDSLTVMSAVAQCRFFQLHCLFNHEDGLVFADENNLILERASKKTSILFPKYVSCRSNRNHLGFKANLNSKYAGSIYIQSRYHSFRLSVAPGLALLRWYN